MVRDARPFVQAPHLKCAVVLFTALYIDRIWPRASELQRAALANDARLERTFLTLGSAFLPPVGE